MNIKLVKNFEEGECSSINEELLLQLIDGNRQLDRFTEKMYFIFNPYTNERFEVLPEISKFNLTKIQYVTCKHDYIIFTSGRLVNERDIEIIYYRYDTVSGESSIVHTQTVELSGLGGNINIKVFVMSADYCIFEVIYKIGDEFSYELILKDITNDKIVSVTNQMLLKYGIDKIIPLSGNLCAIKIGNDIIGTININQFISDMALGLENVYMDILDQSNEQFNLPYMRKYIDYLIYSKHDAVTDTEEIIIYDFINKVKKVRLNSATVGTSNLRNMCVINDIPYYFVHNGDNITMINLNTQKAEYEFSQDITVKYILDDIIVVYRQAKKKMFFAKNTGYVEAYRFPDMKNSILKTRGIYNNCVVHFDDLLVFIN